MMMCYDHDVVLYCTITLCPQILSFPSTQRQPGHPGAAQMTPQQQAAYAQQQGGGQPYPAQVINNEEGRLIDEA